MATSYKTYLPVNYVYGNLCMIGTNTKYYEPTGYYTTAVTTPDLLYGVGNSYYTNSTATLTFLINGTGNEYFTIGGDHTGNTNFTMLSGNNYADVAFDSRVMRFRRNLMPVIKSRAAPIDFGTPEEALALETLREVITEQEFRKYLKYGFVLVRGRSGATYQIYRNRSHVNVWIGGKKVEEVCVYLKAVDGKSAPDTDKVVAFKAMIEADEEAFKAMGNRYRMAA